MERVLQAIIVLRTRSRYRVCSTVNDSRLIMSCDPPAARHQFKLEAHSRSCTSAITYHVGECSCRTYRSTVCFPGVETAPSMQCNAKSGLIRPGGSNGETGDNLGRLNSRDHCMTADEPLHYMATDLDFILKDSLNFGKTRILAFLFFTTARAILLVS